MKHDAPDFRSDKRDCANNTRLLLRVKDGLLIFKACANFPLRRTLFVISVIASAAGYPAIVNLVAKLLHPGC